MSTRAVFVFKDDRGTYAIYKHYDGYPSHALKIIAAAEKKAWPLPRFEADEFGAAFVAAAKHDMGGVRLLNYDKKETCFPHDIEYIYRVTVKSDAADLWVDIYETDVDPWNKPSARKSKQLFAGYLATAMLWQQDNAA